MYRCDRCGWKCEVAADLEGHEEIHRDDDWVKGWENDEGMVRRVVHRGRLRRAGTPHRSDRGIRGMAMKKWGWLFLAGYIGTIFAANWAINHYGIIPVGFGLAAPAGVYFVGLAFMLRDLAQEGLGRVAVIAAIAVGAGLSALVSPRIALASGLAFGVSEGLDMAVYTPLRTHNWLAAAALSNSVGLVVDSILFLWLAFHSLTFLPGQIVGKAWVGLGSILLFYPVRRAVLARNA